VTSPRPLSLRGVPSEPVSFPVDSVHSVSPGQVPSRASLKIPEAEQPILLDILNNPELCRVYRHFLKEFNAYDALEFWMEVALFKRLQENFLIRQRALEIFKKYFSKGSDKEIFVPKEYKDEIKYIVASIGFWDQCLFDRIHLRVLHNLEIFTLPGFLVSEQYRDFVGSKSSRLASIARALEELVLKARKKTLERTPSLEDITKYHKTLNQERRTRQTLPNILRKMRSLDEITMQATSSFTTLNPYSPDGCKARSVELCLNSDIRK